MVVRESRPPVSTEFGRVIREVNLGLPFEQALENMVRRVKSDDLELMATAISIQHTVGGNLAEILDSIAFTIRERVRIQGEIQTLTAQQRLSGYVVGFLPIGLAGFLFVAAPSFLQPMFDDRVSAHRAAGRRHHPVHRRGRDVHRASCSSAKSSTSRSSPMDAIPILIAALAAGAILLIVLGLGRERAGRPGAGPPDPARAPCRRRTWKSSSCSSRSSSGRCARWSAGCRAGVAHASGVVHREDREAIGPGRQPRRSARGRLARRQGGRRRSSAAILFFLLFAS